MPCEAGARTPVVYIAGSGRSGSTVLAQLLERGVDAVHPGELRYLWDRGVAQNHLCECGSPFDRCDFWTAVLHGAYGADVSEVATRLAALSRRVDRLRYLPQAYHGRGHGFRDAMRHYAELITPLYEQLSRVSGNAVVIDSSKDPTYFYVLHNVPTLDLRPVHLVRDPRAVAYSWTQKRRRPEIHWEIQYMRTVAPRTSGREWFIANLAIDLLARRYDQVTRLRYEDLAADPLSAIEGLIESMRLPLRRGAPPETGHSLSGNPMRFESAPLVVRADVRWRSALSPADRRAVTSITLPLLRRYGYPVRVGKAEETACAQ